MSKPKRHPARKRSRQIGPSAFSRLGQHLHAYLRDRARVEGFGYELTPDFFVEGILHGCTFFFGIEVCSHAKLLRDAQKPSPGYFGRWMTAHAHARCDKAHPLPPELSIEQSSQHWRDASDNFTDDALLAKWDIVGERLAREERGQFAHVLELFSGSVDATAWPAELLQWQQLGRDLLERDRRMLAELAISSHLFLDRDKKRTGEGSRSEAP